MWVAFAFGSAFFAGVVAILAKIGIRETPSNLATAIRTIVVLVLAWAMVAAVGSAPELMQIDARTLVLLVLSGLATGASWLCYFRALQIGPVNPVVAVDKSSIVLTVLLGIVVFGETANLGWRLLGITAIGVGTYLMVQWLPVTGEPGATGPPGTSSPPGTRVRRQWLVYAVLAAVFASLTTLLAKAGMAAVESNLGTAIRTVVVVAMAWIVVFATGEQRFVRRIPRRDLIFLLLSGLATGASWLCFFRALQTGPVSVVVPIDKLSIVVTVAFSYLVFRERLTRAGGLGLLLIVSGTMVMLI